MPREGGETTDPAGFLLSLSVCFFGADGLQPVCKNKGGCVAVASADTNKRASRGSTSPFSSRTHI